MTARWGVEPEVTTLEPGAPLVVTGRLVVAAIRRTWIVWVLIAMLGAGAGAAYGVRSGSTSTATLTMLLAHDPSADESTAMSTDDRLLRARPVAEAVIDRLRLPLEPHELQANVHSMILTPQLLSVSVTAADDAEAVREADALADAFLTFRGDQLVRQASAVTDRLQVRVDDIQSEVTILNERYSRLANGTPAEQSTASDILSARSRLIDQIANLEQQIEESTINADAVVTASQVVDPPAATVVGPVRQWVLPVASGFIGGLGLGLFAMVLLALVSDRVRARSDVADALAVPVPYAVGPVTGWNPFAIRRRSHHRRLAGEALLAEGFASPGTTSILAALDATEEASRALLECLRRRGHGTPVMLLNLTDQALVARRDWRRLSRAGRLKGVEVLWPEGASSFAHRDRLPVPPTDAAKSPPSASPATVVLAAVDPGVGVSALASWCDTAILLVATGRTSSSRLRTTAESFETVGPRLRLAMLVNADKHDASSGRLVPRRPGRRIEPRDDSGHQNDV